MRWPGRRVTVYAPATAKGTVWGVRSPTVSFYRILPGKSAEEGRQLLSGYRGIVVADGFAVYEVLAREGPGFTLAHCWAHVKRQYDEIAEQWPVACAAIGALIGELYAIERLVPGPFRAMTPPRPSGINCVRNGRGRCSTGSGTGRRYKWVCPAATSARPCATCSNAGTASPDSCRIRACLLTTMRSNGRSAGLWSAAKITTAHGRCAARKSRRCFIPSARPRSSSASIRTRICSARCTRRSPSLPPLPIRKTFSLRPQPRNRRIDHCQIRHLTGRRGPARSYDRGPVRRGQRLPRRRRESTHSSQRSGRRASRGACADHRDGVVPAGPTRSRCTISSSG
jgi:Transposase IS66 family